ncbi:type II secretion system F family protein [Luteimicrobium xylanilyticum]|uniref:type II secretion system F family protein n=1 Tax=Luteimicrobium xylanilyticum TaxID=1133546 RepID=UPI001D13ADC6|nr:type II secretion system F family protein [Luteimicrobium xylanilyticum]
MTAVLALAGLAPWWVRGDVALGRARALVGGVPDGAMPGVAAPAGRVDGEVVLALVAAACRSGASVVRALDAVGTALAGPDGDALRATASRLALGGGWDDAWSADGPAPRGRLARGAGRGGPDPDRRPGGLGVAHVVGDALRPTWEHGSPPEPALRAAADRLRRDRAERSATAAGRLGVRLVLPLGLCYLPAFVLVGLVPVLVSYGVGLLRSG